MNCASVAKFEDANAENALIAPCSSCGRVMRMSTDTADNEDALLAFIKAAAPQGEGICLKAYSVIDAGEALPSEPPHPCEKSHVCLVRSIKD